MKRFLFIFNSRLAKHGSFEDFMIELGRQARESGNRAGFVFPKIEDKAVADAIGEVGDVFVVDGDWGAKEGVNKLLGVVSDFNADVVDTHFCDFNSFFGFYRQLRKMGIKGVYHYHGEILPIEEMAWWKRFVSSIRYFSWFADEIITVSYANKRFLEFLNVRPPVEVVYNGIDVGRFKGHEVDWDMLAEYGIAEGERYICYLGSLVERKRIDFLLRAFALVLKEVGDVKLLVMGKGDVDKFKAMSGELGISDKVIFTGLMRDYPYGFIKGAQVFVSASKQESFGLVFAEALLLGTPVVACRVGGIPEVVVDGKSGILVDRDDLKGFAKAVVRLLADEQMRKDMVSFGARYVEEKFNLRDRVDELYQKLAQ